MLKITPVCAFHDNYIWVLVNTENQHAACVDPGDANPLLAWLDQHKIKLSAILITHHHWDHTGGIDELVSHYSIPVYVPARDRIANGTHPVSESDQIDIPELNLKLDVLDIPGHTMGHIAYVGSELLFTGDTLFGAGCGRVFEGTYPMMLSSLQKLAQFPDETQIYCGHEYTHKNLLFAHEIEPQNPAIQTRLAIVDALLKQQLPTLPSRLGEEKLTNPFLRCDETEVRETAEKHAGRKLSTPVEVFTVIRQLKDQF